MGGAPEDRRPLLDLLKDWEDEEDGEPCRGQRNLRLPLPADHAFGFAKRGRQPVRYQFHSLTLERARARYGKRRVSEARKWAETVAFFATGCSFLDIAEVVDRSVAQVSKEIYDTWCEDYYIGCVDNIAKLAFDGYLVREQGLDEDGVEPGEVIVLEEYMEGVPQESRGLGTSDVHGV